jgi:hypothetical protein
LDEFFNLRADAIYPTRLVSWPRETIGREVHGGVSDDYELAIGRTDFEELKTIVRELAQAQARIEVRLEELAEAQQRTELRVVPTGKGQGASTVAVPQPVPCCSSPSMPPLPCRSGCSPQSLHSSLQLGSDPPTGLPVGGTDGPPYGSHDHYR